MLRCSQSGASCLYIRQGLPTDPREIESDNVTVVVCMLSKLPKKGYTRFTEGFRHAADTRDLCLHLRRLKRPMRVLGGASALWSMTEGWGSVISKMISIAVVTEITVITGM